tara:strand:- start:13133 stop:14095 length:963 start_codon:yes stop_codon:yes gene_type:complete
MANATPSRLGALNGGSDKDALFLKVFSGEVLTAFEQQTVMMDKHQVRTIANGKSAQFPVMGRTSAAYHTPGAEITGDSINHAEKIITINDLLLTSTFIANIDEAKNHYDVRSVYSREMGVALANQMDKHILQTLIQAANDATATVTGEADMVGTVITDSDSDTNADSLVDSIFAAAQALDEKNVPEDNRYVVVKPAQYYLLANSSKVQNVDFGNAGNGSTASGRIMQVAGIDVLKSNNLPVANVTGTGVDAGGAGGLQVAAAANTTAIVFHPSCAGTVKLMDLSTESEYDIRRQGTLMVAKYAVGHGVLRNEAAVQIQTA